VLISWNSVKNIFNNIEGENRQIDRVCFILDVGVPPHKVKSDTGLGAGQETRALL
jgi:hypothetical protein